MIRIKFNDDEKDIREVRVLFEEEDKVLKETIKTFCIDTIPSTYNPEVTSTSDYFIIRSENGEKVLEHILRFTYLIIKFVEKMGDKVKTGELKPEELDFSSLNEDIEICNNTDWKGLIELLGLTITKDDEEKDS